MGKRQKQLSFPSNLRRENSKAIPVDLLIEVFSRLTVKDLARCRCVSKLWSSVLRRRDFTELFLKISSAQPHILFTFLLNGKRIFYSIPQHLLHPECHMSFPYYRMSFSKSMGASYDYEIRAPVRGFLCSKTGKPMVCNPSTGEYITLPRAKTEKAEMKTFFGYDPIDKLFKVLYVPKVLYVSDDDYVCQVSTVGMEEVSWRMIEYSIPHRPLCTEICIDGVLYYLAECIRNENPKPYMVVCFDVRFEKFKFLDVEDRFLWSTLINCKGKLGVLWRPLPDHVLYEHTKRLELWILEDADELKWSKNFYILPLYCKVLAATCRLYVVGMTSGGDIVLSTSYLYDPFYIVYYNVDTKTMNAIEIQFGNVAKKAKDSRVYTFIDRAGPDLKPNKQVL